MSTHTTTVLAQAARMGGCSPQLRGGAQTMRLTQAIWIRHTDRRPVPNEVEAAVPGRDFGQPGSLPIGEDLELVHGYRR
jgi:hypothetical protein